MSAGILEVSLIIDPAKGTGAIKTINNALDNMGNIGKQGADKVSNSFDSLFGKAISLNQALELGKKAYSALETPIRALIEPASHASEMTSKFFTVFKQEAPAATKFIEDLSDKYNRNKNDIREWMSALQDTFVPLGFSRSAARGMSETLTALTIDLSSFNDVAESQALADLQSYMVGNHETMRKYGVVVTDTILSQELFNMGIKGGVQAASEMEKAQARLNLVIKGTADAQGDAIRTADSFANRLRAFDSIWKDLKIEAGNVIINALIPYMTQLAEWIEKNKDQITAFAKEAGDKISDFLSIIIEVGKTLYYWKDVIIEVGKVWAVYWGASKISEFGGEFSKAISIIKTDFGSLGGSFSSAITKFKDIQVTGTGAFTTIKTTMAGAKGALVELTEKSKLAAIGVQLIGAAIASWAISKVYEYLDALHELYDFQAALSLKEAEKLKQDGVLWRDKMTKMQDYVYAMKDSNTYVEFTLGLEKQMKNAVGATWGEKLNYMRKNKDMYKDTIPYVERGLAIYYIENNVHNELTKTYEKELQSYFKLKGANMPEYYNRKKIAVGETAGAVKELDKAYSDIEKKIIGVNVAEGDLSVQTQASIKYFNNNKDVMSENIDMTSRMHKVIDTLIDSYVASKTEVPQSVQLIHASLESWEQKQKAVAAALAFTVPVMTGLSEGLLKMTGLTQSSTKEEQALTDSIINYIEQIGISTEKIQKLSDEETAIQQVWEKSKDTILGNVYELENTKKIIDDLIAQSQTAGKTIPANIKDISNEITIQEEKNRKLYAASLLVFDGVNGITKAYNMLHPAMATVQTKAVDLTAEFQAIVETSKTCIDALEKMGIISSTLAGVLSGLTGGLTSVGSGISAIQKAETGFLGTLGKISGAVSVVTGAVTILSSILKLFAGKSGELKAVERSLKDLSGFTGDWTKKLEELAKTFGGVKDSSFLALNQLLGEMIRTSDISIQNFDQWIAKVREIYSVYERGTAGASETARNFGSAFSEMVKVAQSLGQEGGAQMTGLLELYRNQGIAVKEVQDYLAANQNKGFEGYKKMKVALDTTGIAKQIDDLKQKLIWDTPKGSVEYYEGLAQLKKLNEEMKYMQGLQKAFGDASIGIYDDMLAYQKKVEANPALTNAIKGWEDALISYSNTNRLTQDQFTKFSGVAQNEFNELTKSGFTSNEALKTIAPQLQRLAYLQSEFGYSIDGATQKLIDQAVTNGDVSLDFKTDSEKQVDAITKVSDVLERVAGLLETRLIGAMNTAAGNIVGKIGTVEGETDVLKAKFQGVQSTMETGLTGAATTAATKINASLKSIQGQTDVWKNKLGGVRDAIDGLSDDTAALDENYTDHMTGHSIVTETRRWETALNDVSKQIDTARKNVENLDSSFKVDQGLLLSMQAAYFSPNKSDSTEEDKSGYYKYHPPSTDDHYTPPTKKKNENDDYSYSGGGNGGTTGSDGETYYITFENLTVPSGGTPAEFANNFIYAMRTNSGGMKDSFKIEVKKIVKGDTINV